MSNTSEDLVLEFTPPLVAVLLQAERAAGRPLAEQEVYDIRDSATCIAVRPSMAEAMATERGYPDIDPEDCWAQWQQVSAALAADEPDAGD